MMKLFLAIIPFPGILRRAFHGDGRKAGTKEEGDDLGTGFTMQMVDAFRHSTIPQ